MKKIIIFLLVFIIVLIFFIVCSNNFNILENNVLNIYNWFIYIVFEVIIDFENKFNVKIQYDIYESNEDFYVKIKFGNFGYDVVFFVDYMVIIMVFEGLLEELNKQNIFNLKNFDDKFIDFLYDLGNKYSVVY